ncbi:6-pyruvoyl tetrahydropterin synthase family protein [Lutibacter sp.]|uniref:6-pyruvoyl trahydropterin synthase family protein n=1 Tax=Lutibacter sp. TaxID=1925666 RepID=UPI003561938E
MINNQFKTSVFRKESFNAAHRLHNANWSDEKNKRIFGKCNNSHFHGHNYDLEVCITGFCDLDTGYVIDIKILSDIIKSSVINKFDHKNLNEELTEFKSLNPTAENIAFVIYNLLIAKLPKELELKIRLYETRKNYVEYPARN